MLVYFNCTPRNHKFTFSCWLLFKQTTLC